jgi:hypothetical protein
MVTMDMNPDKRLRVVLDQIVPAIVDHSDKSFQLRQLEVQEGVAYHLNEACEVPVADLPQYFIDARNEILRTHKEVERIGTIRSMAITPNQT